MKNLVLTLVIALISLVSNAQTDTTGYANKFVDMFKTQVVNVSFKDPYSFQLLSINYTPITNGGKLKSKILADSIGINVYNGFPKLMRTKSLKAEFEKQTNSFNSNKELLNNMSNEEQNKIYSYLITIECRGANSYGNLVYNKYLGEYITASNQMSELGFFSTNK